MLTHVSEMFNSPFQILDSHDQMASAVIPSSVLVWGMLSVVGTGFVAVQYFQEKVTGGVSIFFILILQILNCIGIHTPLQPRHIMRDRFERGMEERYVHHHHASASAFAPSLLVKSSTRIHVLSFYPKEPVLTSLFRDVYVRDTLQKMQQIRSDAQTTKSQQPHN